MIQPQLSQRSGSPKQRHQPQFIQSGNQIFNQSIVPALPSPHSTIQSQTGHPIPYQQFPQTNAKYEDEIIDQEIQQEEELSVDNKISLNKYSLFAAIIMLISSITLFLMTIFSIDSDNHPLIYYTYKFFLYLGIGMIIISIFQIINSVLNSGQMHIGKSQSFFGKLVHFLCVLILGFQLTVIFLCLLIIKIAPDIWIQKFLNSYWYTLFLCQIAFSCADLFILHATFQFNRRPATARIMIYTLLSCQLIIGFCIMSQVKYVIHLINFHNVTDIISQDLLVSFLVIIIIAFALFIILLLVNYSKEGVWMLYFGTLLIILLLIFLNISGVVYRQSLTLQKNYTKKDSQKCFFSLDLIHQDLIKQYSCKKYTEIDNSPYLSCPNNHQIIMWEPETSIGIESRINKRVCINDKCCKSASLIIITEIINAILLNFYFCFCLFMISVYCFYLIPKHKQESSLQRPLEFLFFVIFLCLSVVCILLIINQAPKINHVRDYMIIAEQVKIQPSEIKNVYTVNTFIQDQKWKKFYDILNSEQQQLVLPIVASQNWLRVNILALNYEINVNQLFNEFDLQIFTTNKKETIEQFYQEQSNHKKQTLLLVQGEKEKVMDFLQNQVYLKIIQQQGKQLTINSKEINKQALNGLEQANLPELEDQSIQPLTVQQKNQVFSTEMLENQPNTIKITILQLPESIPIEGVIINLSLKQREDECPKLLSDTEIVYKSVTDNKGTAVFKPIQQATYFVHYSKQGYHTNCISFASSNVDDITFGMVQELKQNSVALLIQYLVMTEDQHSENTFNNKLQLNLYGAFSYAGKECIIGSGFSQCGGMQSYRIQHKKTRSQTDSLLIIANLTDLNYLFYLKNIIEKKDYDPLTDHDKTNINQLWFERKISMAYFVSDCNNPAYFQKQLDVERNTNTQKENNLALLLGCVNAKQNNKFRKIDSLWYLANSQHFEKKNNQQFPYSGYCENYHESN